MNSQFGMSYGAYQTYPFQQYSQQRQAHSQDLRTKPSHHGLSRSASGTDRSNGLHLAHGSAGFEQDSFAVSDFASQIPFVDTMAETRQPYFPSHRVSAYPVMHSGYPQGYAHAEDQSRFIESSAYYAGYRNEGLNLPPIQDYVYGFETQGQYQQPQTVMGDLTLPYPNAGLAPSLHLSHSRHQLAQQQAFFERQQLHASTGSQWQDGHQNPVQAGRQSDIGMDGETDGPREYHDHPSFAKHPHKHAQRAASTGVPPQMPVASVAPTAEPIAVIAEGASSIPPPPSLEKSAHPLSTLATELVWEAFLAATGANSGSGQSSPIYPMNSVRSGDRRVSPIRSRFEDNSSFSPGSPQTHFGRRAQKSASPAQHRGYDRSRSTSGNLDGSVSRGFGAIGGERRTRPANGSPNSESSSPASSAPGTPNMEDFNAWTVHTNDSQSGLPRFGLEREYEDHQLTSSYHGVKEAHLVAPMNNRNRQNSSQSPVYRPPQSSYSSPNMNIAVHQSPAPPAALFDQIQKLLGATLLSQQVLLLALYFVVKVPATSPLYPPATSQSALLSTSAPFKLLLAALVVANKHLDDNSFRNSTFATVSGITLPEVNALEYSLLNALNFDVNVDARLWLTWLRDLEHQQASIANDATFLTCHNIHGIIEGVLGQQCEQALARSQQRHATSLSACVSLSSSPVISVRSRKHSLDMPLTPVTTRSDGSLEMDSAGPLELRPRYGKGPYASQKVVLPQIPYVYSGLYCVDDLNGHLPYYGSEQLQNHGCISAV